MEAAKTLEEAEMVGVQTGNKNIFADSLLRDVLENSLPIIMG